MNLCTDQLAMLVAGPGQLLSVSHLAQDPRSSAMAGEAMAFPANHGLAEEIFLLEPDLILTGSYATRGTVELLRRLGLAVEEFDSEHSLEEVRENVLRMGRLLGREERAAEIVAAFDEGLAALREDSGPRPRAALYYANGYTLGDQTLAASILEAAGFSNIATEAGFTGTAVLPLELLVLTKPDIVISGARYERASRGEEILDHPALAAIAGDAPVSVVSDPDWTCGTPHVLRAIAGLVEARRALGIGQ